MRLVVGVEVGDEKVDGCNFRRSVSCQEPKLEKRTSLTQQAGTNIRLP